MIYEEDIEDKFEKFSEKLFKIIPKKHHSKIKETVAEFKNDAFKRKNITEVPSIKLCFSQEMNLKESHIDEDKFKKQNTVKRKMTIDRKIPVDQLKIVLSQRTLTFEKPEIDKTKYFNLENLTYTINTLSDHIDLSIQNLKKSYYEIGMYLLYTKRYCSQNNLSFINYVQECLKTKSLSTINNYIRFYEMCQLNENIIFNSLSMKQVLDNFKEIKQLCRKDIKCSQP